MVKVGRAIVAALAMAAAIALAGPGPADAAPLPVPVAKQKATKFAKRTCSRDANCVRSGVRNCRRQRPRVVFCRIFLRRNTRFQGRYRCSRLIRLGQVSRRTARVTGIGRWNCAN